MSDPQECVRKTKIRQITAACSACILLATICVIFLPSGDEQDFALVSSDANILQDAEREAVVDAKLARPNHSGEISEYEDSAKEEKLSDCSPFCHHAALQEATKRVVQKKILRQAAHSTKSKAHTPANKDMSASTAAEIEAEAKQAIKHAEALEEKAEHIKVSKEATLELASHCAPFCDTAAGKVTKLQQATTAETSQKAVTAQLSELSSTEAARQHAERLHDQAERARVAKEAAQELSIHCQPFCMAGEGGQHPALRALSPIPPMGSARMQGLALAIKGDPALSVQAKQKIDSATNIIESAMADSIGVPADVRKDMAKMQRRGTSWNALWGSHPHTSRLGLDDGTGDSDSKPSRFEYLARAPGTGSIHSMTDKDPFGPDFHY